jgi:DNA-binding protein HU-beta
MCGARRSAGLSVPVFVASLVPALFLYPARQAPLRLPNTFSGAGMNKTELIDHIAQEADISKAAAGRALDAVIGGVKGTLKKGGSVTLVGFGTFAVGKRTARTGRNPRTGDAIKIKAAKVPKFRPGKALKDALN